MSTDFLGLVDVACAVPVVHVADCKKNTREMEGLIRKADEEGTALIVFPELSITGYTCGDLFFQQVLLDQAKRELVNLCERISDTQILAIVGLPLSINSRIYNCAALIQSGQILGIVPKTFIPENREYYEKRWFTSGKDLNTEIELGEISVPVSPHLLFESRENPEVKLGVEICEDLWTSEPPSSLLAREGAIIICNPSASNETIAKHNYRSELISQQSARLNCAYLYSSCGFGESTQDLVFGGDAIIAEKGALLERSERFQTESFYISAQIDTQILLHDRRIQSSYRDLETQNIRTIPIDLKYSSKLTRNYDKNPFVPSNLDERNIRCEEILNIQAMGLGTRVKKIGDSQMVIGVSGGLDSTLALLVARLVCDKFGLSPEKITAVTMPGFGTTDRTYENAVDLIHKLGTRFREIPIKKTTQSHFEDIGHDPSVLNEVYENAQARERTQILMDIANQENGIVVGTGDLSELALGWATYNGDHMSMYGVNAGIPKTLVRYLVKYYADTGDEEVKRILYDILDTPVSPELLPPDEEGNIQQKTEDKIGPYELHDFFLYHLVRNGFSPKKILKLAEHTFKDEYSPETIEKWLRIFLRRFFSQQFKRSVLPDGPKVGSVTLSPRGDWRMPSDISSEMWLEDLNLS